MLKWIKIVLSLIITFNCFSQKPMVQLIIDPKVAQVGEELTITVKTNVGENINIDLPAALVNGYSVMKGMEHEMDYNSGRMISFYYLSQTGAMSKEGIFTFGPAYVKKGNKVYKSNTVTVKIEKDKPVHMGNDVSTKQMKQPAFGLIEKSKTKIYEGEPVVVSAKIYARFEPTFLDGYQPFEIDGMIESHDLGNNQNISVGESTLRGVRFYSFEYDKKLLFPTQIGKLTVKPFKLNLKSDFDGYSFVSNGSVIEVASLPKGAPKDFVGGVGKFEFSRNYEQKDYKEGDVIELTLVISGEGNLHNIDKPKLKLPKGMAQYGDAIVEDDYTFGYKGSEGQIKYTYHIQLNQSGDIVIPEQTVSYFDPAKEEYVTLNESSISIKVKENPNFVNPSVVSGSKEVSDQIVSSQTELLNKESKKSDLPISLIIGAVSIPLVALLLFFIIKRNSANDKEKSIQEPIRQSKPNVLNKSEVKANHSLRMGELITINTAGNISTVITRIPKVFNSIAVELMNNDHQLIISNAEMFSFFTSKSISNELIEEIKLIILKCDEARYGLQLDPESVSDLVEKTTVTSERLLSELGV